MKLLLVCFLLLLISSCNQDAKEGITHYTLKIEKPSDNQAIFGIWTMCASSGNGTLAQTNACAKIIFNLNGTGIIKREAILDENFTWTLKNSVLEIANSDKSLGNTFTDTLYSTFFNQLKNKTELTLRHGNQDFYLDKSNEK